MADGDCGRYVVLCSQVDVHHHGFGSVDGDIIGEDPLFQHVDAVLQVAEVRAGAFNVNSNGGVIDVID